MWTPLGSSNSTRPAAAAVAVVVVVVLGSLQRTGRKAGEGVEEGGVVGVDCPASRRFQA